MALYIPSANVLFVHIYKTGGTSIRQLLQSHFPQSIEIGTAHSTAQEALALLQISNGEFGRSRLEVFAMTRNPYGHIASLFFYVCRAVGHPWHHRVQEMTFSEFVDFYLDSVRLGARTDTGRVACQYEYVFSDSGVRLVNNLLRYENFNVDVRFLLRTCGITEELAVPHENRSMWSSSIDALYQDPAVCEKIRTWLRSDFEHLDYPLDPQVAGIPGSEPFDRSSALLAGS